MQRMQAQSILFPLGRFLKKLFLDFSSFLFSFWAFFWFREWRNKKISYYSVINFMHKSLWNIVKGKCVCTEAWMWRKKERKQEVKYFQHLTSSHLLLFSKPPLNFTLFHLNLIFLYATFVKLLSFVCVSSSMSRVVRYCGWC